MGRLGPVTLGLGRAARIGIRRHPPERHRRFTGPDGTPYLLINNTNTNTSRWDLSLFVNKSNPFKLSTFLQCNGCWTTSLGSTLPFNIWPAPPYGPVLPGPESLDGVAGECAQLAVVATVEHSAADGCAALRTLPAPSADPCAVRLDTAAVSSVSSRAADLATSTALAASPSSAAPISLPSRRNWAVATPTPSPRMLMVARVLGGLQLCL